MRIMSVAYLGTKRIGLHHTGGVVFGVLTRMINIWFNYQGSSLKSNGSAVLSGSLTQNPDASLKGMLKMLV